MSKHDRLTHNEPVHVNDAMAGKEVCFGLFVNAKTSDNPMQSEASLHIGGNGNHFCRKCTVGGTTEEKESTEGFETLFHVCCQLFRGLYAY